MMHILTEAAYLAAIVLFILALYWMNAPKSARRSVSAGVAAMALAIAATWSRPEVVHHLWVIAALVGGITGLRRVAAMAQEHNLVFTPHTWTNGMGVVANAHLTAGLCDAPFLEFPYDPPEWDVDRRDYMMLEPLKISAEGHIVLSDRPGMGYELDEERLAKTRIG